MSGFEENPDQPEQAVTQGAEGLLFTGDAIRGLTSDQIAAIGDFASRMYGVEMREVHSVEQELGDMAVEVPEHQVEPVRIYADEIWEYAQEIGVAYRPTHLALRALFNLSPLQVVTTENDERIDLRTLYDRLNQLRGSIDYRQLFKREDDTQAALKLLTQLCNDRLRPDEPLEPGTW